MLKNKDKILQLLILIYGNDIAKKYFPILEVLIKLYQKSINLKNTDPNKITNKDIILITYGDQVYESGIPPLKTLIRFCKKYISGFINIIHILPFYPYSSDDGFSVIDYKMVNPELGNWEDIKKLGKQFNLMFDAVINHISSKSEWFLKYLIDDTNYKDFFINIKNNPDLSSVVRPRTTGLLTKFESSTKKLNLWTTFSADQIDLNFENPEVLISIIDLLLFYILQGTQFIRLDAIAYLWKEIGSQCIHHPQTHNIIQIFHLIFNEVCPKVKIITETNVPHNDNISYFGNGSNEADLVYNFALPPLTLHTFHTGNITALSNWIKSLSLPSDKVTFFNFLASHDGIGINPVRGILKDEEINSLVEKVLQHGGFVSYKNNSEGIPIPYELNINYFDALSNPKSDESQELQIDRFIAAHAIMLSLAGLPGIYFHSLIGSKSWVEGTKLSGQNRTINRQKLKYSILNKELKTINNIRNIIYNRLKLLIKTRTSSNVFDPYTIQKVLNINDFILVIIRENPHNKEKILCLQNISNNKQNINLDNIEDKINQKYKFKDIITGRLVYLNEDYILTLNPYQTLWLKFIIS